MVPCRFLCVDVLGIMFLVEVATEDTWVIHGQSYEQLDLQKEIKIVGHTVTVRMIAVDTEDGGRIFKAKWVLVGPLPAAPIGPTSYISPGQKNVQSLVKICETAAPNKVGRTDESLKIIRDLMTGTRNRHV